MKKNQFLTTLRKVITSPQRKAEHQTATCRCVGCYSEKQKRQGKSASTS